MRKKIAFIGLKGLPSFGGAAAVGENIINELKNKYDITVYSSSSHSDKSYITYGFKQIIFPKIINNKINVISYYLMSCFHCIFINKYDLIHLHHISSAFILPFLKMKYLVVTTSHGNPFKEDKWKKYKKSFNILEYLFFKYSDCITTMSQELFSIYSKVYGNNCNIKYIPNGINIPPFFNINKNNSYILFSANRIIEIKGCHLFLQALKNINYKGKIIIIGDINQIKEYKNNLLKIAEVLNVEFIPVIKNKYQLYNYIANAKLFIFPSLFEAMSMMLLEVASIKTPIICSNIKSNKNVFTSDEVLFFESNNIIDLGEKIIWALNNMELMIEKSEKAFSKLLKNYLWTDITKKYDLIYSELLMNK